MKEKILPFIRKYPMSILLGLIAIQLVNISGKLNELGKYDGDMRACLKYYAVFDVEGSKTEEREIKSASAKIGIPADIVDAYCRRILM